MTDVILLGGGLANGLIALRLAARRPDVRVTIIEPYAQIGGNHTWSFFDSDLSADQHSWIAPLLCHRWPGYSVTFPNLHRRIACGYRSVTSEKLHQVISGLPQIRTMFGRQILRASADQAEDSSGGTWRGACLIDGRGYRPDVALSLGYQKFVGLEFETKDPHNLAEPILMDACVAQRGDYRFLYVLPLDGNTLLVEDTRYSDFPSVDFDGLKQAALDYARQQGWQVSRIRRTERGILPVVLGGDIRACWQAYEGGPAPVGLRGGFFHHTTGYSFADAVRVAEMVADTEPLTSEAVFERLHIYARQLWSERGFYRGLNRMLFGACKANARYKIMQRFYRLPQALIERFYASKLTPTDKLRLISGRPPVHIGSAVRSLIGYPQPKRREAVS